MMVYGCVSHRLLYDICVALVWWMFVSSVLLCLATSTLRLMLPDDDVSILQTMLLCG